MDLAISGVTLSGSLLSSAAVAFIIIRYFWPYKSHPFRNALVINLLFANFANALNNSISGMLVLTKKHPLAGGAGCTWNGFIGQLSAQAVDCSTFSISFLTLCYFLRPRKARQQTVRLQIVQVVCVWILPLLTSLIALGMGYFHPVTGNWCWIQEHPVYLRYVLAHGWRFTIIIFIIIQIIVIRLRLRYSAMYPPFFSNNHDSDVQTCELTSSTLRSWTAPMQDTTNNINIQGSSDVQAMENPHKEGQLDRLSLESARPLKDKINLDSSRSSFFPAMPIITSALSRSQGYPHAMSTQRLRNKTLLRKIRVLQIYPILYVILWLPGIASRISEAIGYHLKVLELLQASTQFIGLANAIAFELTRRMAPH